MRYESDDNVDIYSIAMQMPTESLRIRPTRARACLTHSLRWQTVTREGGLTLRTGATIVLEVSSEDTVTRVRGECMSSSMRDDALAFVVRLA